MVTKLDLMALMACKIVSGNLLKHMCKIAFSFAFAGKHDDMRLRMHVYGSKVYFWFSTCSCITHWPANIDKSQVHVRRARDTISIYTGWLQIWKIFQIMCKIPMEQRTYLTKCACNNTVAILHYWTCCIVVTSTIDCSELACTAT